jgi:hypothetical protein
MFGLDYYHPQTSDRLIYDYYQALAKNCSAVTDRSDNLQLHQALDREIQQQLR